MKKTIFICFIALFVVALLASVSRSTNLSDATVDNAKRRGNGFSVFLEGSEAYMITEAGMRAYEEENFEKAEEFFRKASDMGYSRAQYALALMQSFGDAEEEYVNECLDLMLKAADNLFFPAEYRLGFWFEINENIYMHMRYAMEWYTRAAKRGSPEAQGALGKAYGAGKGVQADLVRACAWLTLAVEGGHTQSKDLLRAIESKLSTAEQAEAFFLEQEMKALYSKSHDKSNK